MSGDDAEDEDWFEQALAADDADGSAEEEDWFEDSEAPTADSESTESFEDALADAGSDTSQSTETSTEQADADEADDEEGSLFDEDFGSALQSAGGPGEQSGSDGGRDADFGEEDFESEIPRIDLGIEGLDEMIQGGVPERHLMVAIGSPGTGKTTFGLQFLQHGLRNDQDAVFITLEQSRRSILDTANERGWDFDRYEREDRLAIVDLDPVEMANSLQNIRAEFPQLVREFGADRLVLDSVSLLEMMYDDQARRRTEVFDFTRSLKDAGVTTMLTSEASEDNPYASRHGIIEYLTDAVFVLQYVRGDTQETRLAVEIQKIRNANHSRQTKPYAITLDGIDVYQQASIF